MKANLTGVVLALALASAGIASVQADSFTYHGTLAAAGTPANGRYDLRLTLYSAEHGGSVMAGPVDLFGVEVLDGHFSAPVDFGRAAVGSSPTWLAVAVKAADGAWEALDGRSAVAPAGNSCPASWALDGNAGNPAGSYLGTADAQDLFLRTNGVDRAIFHATTGAVELAPGAPATGRRAVALAWSWGANGDYSFAGGSNGETKYTGSFVWGDFNGARIADSASDQFIVGAKGGVGINTATADNGTSPLNKTLTLAPATGSSSVSLSMRTSANHSWGFQNLVDAMLFGNTVNGSLSTALWFGANATTVGVLGALPSPSKPFVVGTNSSTGNGAYLSPGGVWTNASSRFFKQGFAHVDATDVLARLVAMPIQTWFYLDGDAEGRHLGPVAEDFASAFGLGNDSQHISTVDANGVALVAIQGLNSKLEDDNAQLRARLDAVQAENVALRERLDGLAAAVARLVGRAE